MGDNSKKEENPIETLGTGNEKAMASYHLEKQTGEEGESDEWRVINWRNRAEREGKVSRNADGIGYFSLHLIMIMTSI